MGFEALAPPARSRLWDDEAVDAAQEVLAQNGRVGWNSPYDSEGKARGAGSALARLLAERTEDAYRVSVFERKDDPEKGIEAGHYFSIKRKVSAELVDPNQHNKNALIELAASEGVENVSDKDSKAKIAKAINAKRKADAEAPAEEVVAAA